MAVREGLRVSEGEAVGLGVGGGVAVGVTETVAVPEGLPVRVAVSEADVVRVWVAVAERDAVGLAAGREGPSQAETGADGGTTSRRGKWTSRWGILGDRRGPHRSPIRMWDHYVLTDQNALISPYLQNQPKMPSGALLGQKHPKKMCVAPEI